MRTGFIGLGAMGRGMAANLVRAGHPTTVYDIRPEAVADLAGLGARPAAAPGEVAVDAELVCLAVFDEAQVRSVLLDPGGVLDTAPREAVIAIHATVSPAFAAEMAAAAEERGLSVVDAAMTGGSAAAAEAGRLTLMVGGTDADVERVRSPFEAMAQTVFHLGPVGTGMGIKIVSNFLSAGNLALVREAERIATGLGIDEPRMLEVVNTGKVGASWVTENWTMIRRQEENRAPGIAGPSQIVPKDLKLADALARSLGVSAPVLAAIVADAAPDILANGVTVRRSD